jgi:hypothetical protein
MHSLDSLNKLINELNKFSSIIYTISNAADSGFKEKINEIRILVWFNVSIFKL